MRSSCCFVLVWLAVAGCGESVPAGPPRASVDFSCDCSVGEECSDEGVCVSISGGVAECEGAVECNGTCCESGEICFEESCVADCESPSQHCGDESDICCASGEGCVAGACVPLRDRCTLDEDCELDELCEVKPTVAELAPTIGCRWAAPEAPTAATDEEDEIAGMTAVVMTPAVANLTDDNGDGVTDALDTPDLVFVSFDYAADGCCTPRGVVRVVSGACNGDGTMPTHATLKGHTSDDWIGNSSGVALGNLHPDQMNGERVPEIVATFKNGGAIAWRRTAEDGSAWEVMWQNDLLPTNRHSRGGAQPSIADLNADGRPEVVIGNLVLDGLTGKGPGDDDLAVGALAWDGRDLEAMTPGANLGIGNNGFLGPVSTVADLDRDGLQEVIAGNTVYNFDGTERWTFEYTTANSSCNGSLDCDGYTAVGNFDGDEEGEVVIVRLGELFILNHDGTAVAGIPLPIRIPGFEDPEFPDDDDVEDPTYSPAAYNPSAPLYDEHGNLLPPERILCPAEALHLFAYDELGNPIMNEGAQVVVHTAGANESGPPTVADFDGDGFAEVGTAGSTAYVLFDFQCTGNPLPEGCRREWVRWMVESDDCSSRVTGASVFDFEGDGSAELLYADETSFRIFDGVDGSVLFRDDSHSSNTRLEMPIVVDVDNDGKSEIVVPEQNLDAGHGGITIWEDVRNNWVRARRIWNQHSYSVTNVTEDGQIPRLPESNWRHSRLNNFRQNAQVCGDHRQ